MSRLVLVLVLALGLAGGAAATHLLRPVPDAPAIRAVVEAALAERPPAPAPIDRATVETMLADALATTPAADGATPAAATSLDPATLNPMIEAYLLDNPEILQRVSVALEAKRTEERAVLTRAAMTDLADDLYNAPGQVVLGNPDGDVTLIELFDYNCGYCRQALPDLAKLVAEDPNLRIILKEFPILSQGSVDAARVAIQVAQSDADYWAFHQALFTARGQITKEAALAAAGGVGLNPLTLELGMNTPAVTAELERSYNIAQRLDISGTPTFIIGDEVIPGAVGADQLRLRIDNMRACGATACPASPPG